MSEPWLRQDPRHRQSQQWSGAGSEKGKAGGRRLSALGGSLPSAVPSNGEVVESLPIAHIVWDWNGTLLDDLDLVVESVNVALARHGVAPIDTEEYRRHFRRPIDGFYERLLRRRVDDGLLAAIDEVFQEHYWAGYPGAALVGDAIEALDMVVGKDATQSLVSMAPHDLLVTAVRRFGIDERMLAVDGHRGRPGETKAGHMVRHVERLAELFPQVDQGDGMVAIGDLVDDAEAARAAGIRCVLFDGGSQTRTALEAAGVPVANTLVEAVEAALSG